jgi:16S rRNA (uracil1498-N3)-methyltransferase
LFNGRGGEYEAILAQITPRGAAVDIGIFRAREAESPLHVCLVQAVSRAERMDYTVQKAVELGVREIVPVITERCLVRLDNVRGDRRLQHWRAIIVSACQQCGRNRIPDLRSMTQLTDWLGEPADGSKLLLDPGSTACLGQLPRVDGRAVLLAGPEGGLSERELVLARAAGYVGVRLGPRILRTETASLAAVSALQTLWGDLAGSAGSGRAIPNEASPQTNQSCSCCAAHET